MKDQAVRRGCRQVRADGRTHMSSSDVRWTELASQNERVIRVGEAESNAVARAAAQTQWAELASQSERLVGAGDPLFRLASSRHHVPGMRLVAGAA
jgi:hypothetical protein